MSDGWGTEWFLFLDALILIMLVGAFTLGYRAGKARG